MSHFSNVLQGNMEDLEMCLMWVSKDILVEPNTKWYWGQVNVAQQRHMSAGSVLKEPERFCGPRPFQFFLSSTVGHFGHPDL